MGKKGSWFSAFKQVFVPNSKEKLEKGAEKKSVKEKKKGRGILTHGESRSFIPLFRGPSSIEKILGEADLQQIQFRLPAHYEQPKTSFSLPSILPSPRNASLTVVSPKTTSPKVTSPRATSPRVTSPGATSPKVTSPRATSPRVTSPRATSPRVTSLRATSPRVTSPSATSPRVTSPRATLPRVTSPRATLPRVTSPRATLPRVTSPKPVSRKLSSPRPASPRAASLVTAQPRVYCPRPEPTQRNNHLSAVKIQSAYRGYMARRSFRALRSLVRLQVVVRGQNVKRQTKNAMKHMQLLVRVQTQIQSWRILMLENQAVQRSQKRENALSEAGDQEYWDDSLLTKEEVDARMQKKREAILKRERAMAYAYSNQGNQKPDQIPLVDIKSGGFPWWLTWLERQIPCEKPSQIQPLKNFLLTPSRPTSEKMLSPQPQSRNYKHSSAYDNLETPTPKSSKSTASFQTRTMFTPSRTPPTCNSMKYSRPRNTAADSTFDVPLNDNDSLMSCPQFSFPNYMTPTASAKAKVRPKNNPRERFPGTHDSETSSKRRFSFPMTPSIGPFKWNKGSTKDSPPPRVFDQRQPLHFTGDRSIDSTVSMPAVLGRRPFNRFV